MRLRDALGVRRGDVVAFIGAGGKTSALFRLADELRADGWRVLGTTTTRLAAHEVQRAPLAISLTPEMPLSKIGEWLNQYGFVFLHTEKDITQQKVKGLSSGRISELMDAVNSDVLLIEADGARRLPLKAPYDHEPVIPSDTSLVVPVAGMDALGQPLDEEHVYNAARIRARYGFPEGGIVLPPWMAVTIRDEELGLRGVPDAARVVVLLNQVAAVGYQRQRAQRIAQLILRSSRVDAIALGEMQTAHDPVHECLRRVGAVILAAGVSARMGQSKVLLPWDGRTVIEAIVTRLMLMRLPEIVVVTGHRAADVARALRYLPAQTSYNPQYMQGEMLSSLQAGLRALPDSTAACLVVLGDQPFLDERVVGRILAAYAVGQGEIIVPVHRGQRGHPVLFSRRFWPDLLALEAGMPRDVIQRYPDYVHQIEVSTDSILRDIDTPAQYQRERFLAGLR